MVEVSRGWVRLCKMIFGYFSLGEVGCGFVKQVKVYYAVSCQVVNEEGYQKLAFPVLTVRLLFVAASES